MLRASRPTVSVFAILPSDIMRLKQTDWFVFYIDTAFVAMMKTEKIEPGEET